MAGIVETGPDRLAETLSLGELIAGAQGRAVHILFVHGIRVGDRGASAAFRERLRERVPGLSDPTRATQRLDLGDNPGVSFMGTPVWPEDAGWRASAPFVDRFAYARTPGGPIIVDEVNWWPLVLPLRCQALLAPEAQLAGADVAHLRLCAGLDMDGTPFNDDVHYPWLAKARLDALLAQTPPLAGAARLNGFVKRELMDWGLSDAVIALGPMKRYLHATLDQAFALAEQFTHGRLEPTAFVIVAESLGSFMVFDAYAHAKPHVRDVLDRTAHLYFFANQLALLELGRLHDPSGAAASPLAQPGAPLSLHQALVRWASVPGAQPHEVAPAPCKQIVAFSDPSDALTLRVPAIPNAKVVNICDRNGRDLLRLAADPVAAHTGHVANPAVLDLVFRTT